MSEAVYHIIVIVVAVLAVVKGYRSGFTGQVSGILGFAFGAVCAHVFSDEAEAVLRHILPGISHTFCAGFIYSVLAAVSVYLVVYYIFRLLTGVLRKAMEVLYVSVLDSIFGAAFCLLKYMLLISIVYNLLLCINPSSPLVKYANADDGNVVECVMFLAPACLGCCSVDDLHHLIQLREAKRISRNLTPSVFVYKVCDSCCHRDKIYIENA